MVKFNRLVSEFYELKVNQLMDKRIWDLPIIEKNEDVHHVLSILSARNHIWVVNDKKNKEIAGVITEHEVLSILTPKKLPPYVFGIPDIKSVRNGTANKAEDIMRDKVITCKSNDRIIDALDKMIVHRLRRLPVVEDKKIIGELTLHQLIRKYYDATQYHPIVEEKE